jgi:hypothetical protein
MKHASETLVKIPKNTRTIINVRNIQIKTLAKIPENIFNIQINKHATYVGKKVENRSLQHTCTTIAT